MSNDFNQIIDRSRTNSAKWATPGLAESYKHAPYPLPMSVGDMDFRVPKTVIDILSERVCQGVFGYPDDTTQSYLKAFTMWQKRRFNWSISQNWIVPTQGAVTGLKAAIRTFTKPGDKIIALPPVYGRFFRNDISLDRRVVCVPLQLSNNQYQIDYETLEAVMKNDTKIIILCNPNNPTGTVWSKKELHSLAELCLRYGTFVIADEVHQDLVVSKTKQYTLFASLNKAIAQRCIVATSAGKSFNLSGLQCANFIIPNEQLRNIFVDQLVWYTSKQTNILSMIATEAAYAEGEAWLDELLAYIRSNQTYFSDALSIFSSKLTVYEADALYYAWIDCRALGVPYSDLQTYFAQEVGICVARGDSFGAIGDGYVRVNLACPRPIVEEAVRRLKRALTIS